MRPLNEKKLSNRLSAVADQLIPNKKLADIGTDHAYLPCYAYLKGLIPSAIGSEVNEGPYRSAQSLVRQLSLSEQIDLRFGDGLSTLDVGEVEQITIAGMGGSLIVKILEEGKLKLKGVERLILQPNVAADKVRKWLYNNNWKVINELILEEDDIVYEIVVAERGKDLAYIDYEKEFLFGRFLLKEKSTLFRKKWDAELKKLNMILDELNKAERSAEVEEKQFKIEKMIQLIKEALL